MAISKEEKEAILSQYMDWLGQSQAIILVEYTGSTMKEMDTIRRKLREIGSEFHVVKNTLMKLAMEKVNIPFSAGYLEKSTAIGFAFKDAIVTAKVINDFSKTIEAVKIKAGYMGTHEMSAMEIKAMAELPPLPVMRGRLLGILLAPAAKLARTLAEPGRQLASIVKTHSEQTAPAAA